MIGKPRDCVRRRVQKGTTVGREDWLNRERMNGISDEFRIVPHRFQYVEMTPFRNW